MELRHFAKQVLFATTLEEKLRAPRLITDLRPGKPMAAPSMPGRPVDLKFKSSRTESPRALKLHQLDDTSQRGRLLHFFANHELLATELMALVLLKFPEAPWAFRRGVLRTLREEQAHTQLYLRRMRECGVHFGELPVSGFIWRAVSSMESPADYVAGLSLTFEQANLDYCQQFAGEFARAGDAATARLLRRIYRDEINHVAYGLKWFRHWKSPALSDWAAYRRQLSFPLSPRRAKGAHFNIEGRRLAGLDDGFIQELEVFSQSKGRTPTVHVFNPLAEAQLALGRRFQPNKSQAQFVADLANLPQFLAVQDDIVLVPRRPSGQFLRSIQAAGLPLPEFVEWPHGAGPSQDPLWPKRKLGGLRPWAWTPGSIAMLSPLFPQTETRNLPCGGEFPTALRELYSKGWSADFLRRLLTGNTPSSWLCDSDLAGHLIVSLDQAREAIAALRAQGFQRLVVKQAYGLAGHHMIRLWEPALLESHRRWMERSLDSGLPLVLEPWLDRVLDFSLQYEMTRTGLRELGVTELLTDVAGRYQGNVAWASFRRRLPGRWAQWFPNHPQMMQELRQWYEAMRAALEKVLFAAQYGGPLGVDAMVFRDKNGAYRVKPVVEINPRCTMGRLALQLMDHVCPGRTGVLRVIGISACARWGLPNLAECALRLQCRFPILLQGTPKPRLSQGVLCLNDSQAAASTLAIFEVLPSSAWGADPGRVRSETEFLKALGQKDSPPRSCENALGVIY